MKDLLVGVVTIHETDTVGHREKSLRRDYYDKDVKIF
jgi:hypothetical protein